MAPLIWYLFGPGKACEHTDPHLVAGWRHPAELEPPLRPDGKRDFRRLTGLLKQPQALLGDHGYARPVWHCALRAAPQDRMLSDEQWAQIAADVMDRTGLSPHGQEDQAVRWVAVRHGDDHIHLVAMLARQDGGTPSLSFERVRVRAACLAAERRYGLRSTAPADRTAPRRPSRAESEKAARRGLGEAPRITLRRHVTTAAAGAGSQAEFFARLDRAGVLIRKRFSTRTPGQVTGYAVAVPGDTAKDGGPIWYSGGKLAADLTWPKLRHRWTRPGTTPSGEPLTATDQKAIWEHAAQVAADATARIRALAASNPAAAADAAWAASDTLHVAAAALDSPALRQAADTYDRAARAPYGRIPRAQPGREPAPPRRPAHRHARLPHPRPGAHAPGAHHPAGRPGRSRRRTAPLPSSTPPKPPPPAPPPSGSTPPPGQPPAHRSQRIPVPAPPTQLADESFPQPFRSVPRKPPPGQPRPGHSPRPGRGPAPPRPRGPRR